MRLKQPRQLRSRATLQRVVAATEYLLEKRPLEELTVSQVVNRAGSSVGSFYGRFRDKEALLDYVDEVYGRVAVRGWEDFLGAQRPVQLPLSKAIDAIVRRLVLGHRRKLGLARAIYLYVRRSEPTDRIAGRAKRINAKVEQLIVGHLMEWRQEIRSEHPERAIRVGLLFTVGAMREAILFGHLSSEGNGMADEPLIEELTSAFWNHVRTALRSRYE